MVALEFEVLYNAFVNWKLALILVAGTCFCISSAAYLFVKIVLRPKQDGDWEECYWEFEEQHRPLAKYNLWCKITFTAVIISMLLLFISISI